MFLETILSDLGYCHIQQQRNFIKLLLLRGCFDKPARVNVSSDLKGVEKRQAELSQLIYTTWPRDSYTTPFEKGIVNDDVADSFLQRIDFRNKLETLRWLYGVTQLRFLRTSFFQEHLGSNVAPTVYTKRWEQTTTKSSNALDTILRNLGLMDAVVWPVDPDIHHVAIHGCIEKYASLRINYLKPFSGKLYYLTNPRGLFNDEPSLAPILASWFGKPEYEEAIQAVLEKNQGNDRSWLGDLAALKDEILKAIGEFTWPCGRGWYYRNSALYEKRSMAEERSSLKDWPVAMDMVEYLFERLKQENPGKFDRVQLVPVLTIRKYNPTKPATTVDTLIEFKRLFQEELKNMKIVFVSDNVLHCLQYQDAITRNVFPEDIYSFITVGPAADKVCLKDACHALAVTIFEKNVHLQRNYAAEIIWQRYRFRKASHLCPSQAEDFSLRIKENKTISI